MAILSVEFDKEISLIGRDFVGAKNSISNKQFWILMRVYMARFKAKKGRFKQLINVLDR